MQVRALQANFCQFPSCWGKQYNRVVDVVEKNTFQWVAKVKIDDRDSTMVKVAKIFVAILFSAPIIPLVGLFIVARMMHLFGGDPVKAVPAAREELPVEVAAHPIQQLKIFDPGSIPRLIGYLNDPVPEVRMQAARHLATLADVQDRAKDDIRNGGGIVKLLDLLKDPWIKARGAAADALQNLVLRNPANQVAIGKAAGVKKLCDALVNADKRESLFLLRAMKALGAVVMDNEVNQNAALDTEVIPKLVGFLNDPNVGLYAAVTLFHLINGHEGNQEKGLQGHIIPVLVPLLQKPNASGEFKTTAVQILAELALSNFDARIEIPEDIFPRLVELLEDPKREIRYETARLLGALTIDLAENRRAIGDAGAIKPLTKLLTDPNEEGESNNYAVWAIRHLAEHNPVNQQKFRDAGAIPVLVTSVGEADLEITNLGMEALVALARENPGNQEAIRQTRVIQILADLLGRPDEIDREAAMGLLMSISRHHPLSHDAIRKSGIFGKSAAWLNHADWAVQFDGAIILDWFVLQYAENKEEIRLTGAIPKLATFLGSNQLPLVTKALFTLNNLGRNHLEIQARIREVVNKEDLEKLILRLRGAEQDAANTLLGYLQ